MQNNPHPERFPSATSQPSPSSCGTALKEEKIKRCLSGEVCPLCL